MKTINRGYLMILFKQSFLDWSNKYNDLQFQEGEVEPSLYLIEDDFIEDDKVIEGLFKKIMMIEFTGVTENEVEWPTISREVFDSFFSYVLGISVIDLVKGPLQREEI
jgi:hypothetical protein